MMSIRKALSVFVLLFVLAGCSEVEEGNDIFTVTFDYDAVDAIQTTAGTEIVLPFVESDTGFFLGWEDAEGSRYDETYTVASDITLTPVFEAFDDVLDLRFNDNKNTVTIVEYTGTASHVKIPQTFDEYIVTKVDEQAFRGSLARIIELPMTVYTIGTFAFAEMPYLEAFHYYGEYLGTYQATLSESDFTEYIEDYDACTVPSSDNPTESEPWVFDEGCPIIKITNMEGPVLSPDGTENYAYSAEIANAYALPERFDQRLNYYVFYNSHNLKRLTLPDKLNGFHGRWFIGLEAINELNIVAGERYYTKDGLLYEKETDMLVYYPSGLLSETFAIPDHISHIGYEAFHSNKVKTLSLHENVTFEDGAFAFLLNLESVEVDEYHETLTDVNGVVYSKDLTDLIMYPAGKFDSAFTIEDETTAISTAAFYNARFIRTLVVTEGVTTIEDAAFIDNTALESVDLPTTLTSIGNNNFLLLTYPDEYPITIHDPLETLILRNPDQVVEIEGIRLSRDNNTAIYVPDHLYDDYAQDPMWQHFLSYLKPFSELVE